MAPHNQDEEDMIQTLHNKINKDLDILKMKSAIIPVVSKKIINLEVFYINNI